LLNPIALNFGRGVPTVFTTGFFFPGKGKNG